MKQNYFDNKTILVTGGTGSMGKTFVRRVLTGEMGNPKKIIVFSRDEGKQHDMRLKFLHKKNSTDEVVYNNFKKMLEFRIGDIRNYADVVSACKGVDFVINASALKQVPSCEYFPEQAIATNCIGAINIVRAIRENDLKVDTVVGISTDKACKPINVMGMTKSLQEKIFHSANILNPNTRYICVRYGNVLASRGSVIPLFHEQIKAGGPITITTPEMTRFLLTLDQAVDTVFKALLVAVPGETIVPRAPAALMTDVAKVLTEGMKVETIITGIRPGEKLHEIMISDEEAPFVRPHDEFYGILPLLPELNSGLISKEPVMKKEFSSGDSLLNFEGVKNLLKKNNLLFTDKINFDGEEELLR